MKMPSILIIWIFLVTLLLCMSHGDSIGQELSDSQHVTRSNKRIRKGYTGVYNSSTINRLHEEQKRFITPGNYGKRQKLLFQRDFLGTYYGLSNLWINEREKFLYCPIHKVGTTLFKQLFNRMDGHDEWFDEKLRALGTPAWKIGKKKLMEIFNGKYIV